MDFVITLLLIMPLAIAYIVEALRLERVESHEGPFKSKTRRIVFPDGHVQVVCLWDWIRRVFLIYEIDGEMWHIKSNRNEAWECKFCLSFWVTVPFSAILLYVHPQENMIMIPVYHFCMVSASLILGRWL